MGFLSTRFFSRWHCVGQHGVRYLNILRHPVGLLSTFQQLVLNLLNLDKPTEKLFQVYIPPINTSNSAGRL